MNNKRTIIRIAESRFRRRIKRKKKSIRSKKQFTFSKKKKVIRKYKNIGKQIYPKIHIAPYYFSFNTSKDIVVDFMNSLEKDLVRGNPVFVSLKEVIEIDLLTIVLLLGIMAEFKSKKVKFNGNFPDDIHCRKLLFNSGFLEKLYFKEHKIEFGNEIGIYTNGNFIIDQILSAKIISNSLEKIFGVKKRNQGAQRILIEAMKNTYDHANPNERCSWYLSTKVDLEKVTYSFLDYGIGIFKSLKRRNKNDPGYNWFESLIKLGSSNAEILRKIMSGELQNISKTRLSNRGNGLPGMKTAIDNNFVSNFTILTNDVYCNISQGSYQKINSNFSGTLIQFEILKSNKVYDE